MTSYAARVLITNLLLWWGLFIQFSERKPAFPKYTKNTYRIRNVAIYKSNCSPVPHYARKIIGDKTLFLRFCLRLRFVMQTKIFKNTFQTRGVSQRLALRLSVNGKHFENGGFQNDEITVIMCFFQTQIQNDRQLDELGKKLFHKCPCWW